VFGKGIGHLDSYTAVPSAQATNRRFLAGCLPAGLWLP